MSAAVNVHPSWCQHETCRGDHVGEMRSVAATAEIEPEQLDLHGAVFPAVTVHAAADNGMAPSMALQIGSPDLSTEVFLRPEEAGHLLECIAAVLSEIEGQG